MKKALLILISLYSISLYAFFGLFEEEKRPDPMSLETEKEQMEYLRKYLPESYERVLEYKNYLNQLTDAKISLQEANDEWNDYEKYSAEMIDVESEKRKKLKEKKEKKRELELKVKNMEKEILSKFKLVNGKLVNKKEENDANRKMKEEQILRKRIIEFQKEHNMSVLKEGQNIKVKKE